MESALLYQFIFKLQRESVGGGRTARLIGTGTLLVFTGTGKTQTDLVGGLHVLNDTHIQRPRSASFPLLQQHPLPKAVGVF